VASCEKVILCQWNMYFLCSYSVSIISKLLLLVFIGSDMLELAMRATVFYLIIVKTKCPKAEKLKIKLYFQLQLLPADGLRFIIKLYCVHIGLW